MWSSEARLPLSRRAVLTVLLGASIVACSSGASRSSERTQLRFGVLLSVDQLPYFVMRARGFDRANGLAIEETVVQGGTGVLKGLAAGTLDAGFPGTVPVLNASRTGAVPDTITVVGSVAFADADHRAFAVLAGSGVTGWASLAGQDVAINQPGTIGDAALQVRLRQLAVPGVHLVSIAFPNQGLAVAGRNVAAAAMIEPFITQSLMRGDGHVLDWVVGGGEPFYEFEESVIAVSKAYATQHPEAVKAFLRGYLDAVAWIDGHEREARDLLSQRLGLPPEVGRQMHLVRFAHDARNDAGLLSQTREVLVRLDPSPAPVKVERMYDETLLDQVLAGRAR